MREAQEGGRRTGLPRSTPPECFGPRLRQLRLRRGLSQTEAAEAIGVRYHAYADYEAGETSPFCNGLVRICTFFRVSPTWLLGLDENGELETPVLESSSGRELRAVARACLDSLAAASASIRELSRKVDGEQHARPKGRKPATPKAHPA